MVYCCHWRYPGGTSTWKCLLMDRITAEMLKYGGDAVVEWMLLIGERAWIKVEVPDDWKKAIIVPLYKGKGR